MDNILEATGSCIGWMEAEIVLLRRIIFKHHNQHRRSSHLLKVKHTCRLASKLMAETRWLLSRLQIPATAQPGASREALANCSVIINLAKSIKHAGLVAGEELSRIITEGYHLPFCVAVFAIISRIAFLCASLEYNVDGIRRRKIEEDGGSTAAETACHLVARSPCDMAQDFGEPVKAYERGEASRGKGSNSPSALQGAEMSAATIGGATSIKGESGEEKARGGTAEKRMMRGFRESLAGDRRSGVPSKILSRHQDESNMREYPGLQNMRLAKGRRGKCTADEERKQNREEEEQREGEGNDRRRKERNTLSRVSLMRKLNRGDSSNTAEAHRLTNHKYKRKSKKMIKMEKRNSSSCRQKIRPSRLSAHAVRWFRLIRLPRWRLSRRRVFSVFSVSSFRRKDKRQTQKTWNSCN